MSNIYSSERRIKMKKDQDITERLAFHLITYRAVAINVATNGLSSDQLSFPIEKYLGEYLPRLSSSVIESFAGNPQDGVHLCRRPDVLLTSSGNQGLYRFGLLVCKVKINSKLEDERNDKCLIRYFWAKVSQRYHRVRIINYLLKYIMIIIFVKIHR